MDDRYTRTRAVLGDEAINRLKNSSVLLFGVGGVGSYTAEALIRAGVGAVTIVDSDTIDISNCNRQLPALSSTVGKIKVDIMADRMRDIAPDAVVIPIQEFVSPETIGKFHFEQYSYVVDAIDNVTAKLLIIERCAASDTPVISCMGTGNKRDPSRFRITDIGKSSVCPLARVMRHELKKRGINNCLALWSDEEPKKNDSSFHAPGSLPFVPPVAGMMIAGHVILTLAGQV